MHIHEHAPKTSISLCSCMLMCGFFVLACVLAAPLRAQTPDYAALETIFLDESLGALDFDAHAAKLVPLIEKNPASVEAVIALRTMQEYDEKLTTHDAIYKVLCSLESQNFRACGIHAHEFAEAYLFYGRRLDASGKPLEVFKRWRGITEFSVIGPFAEYGAAAHDDVFPPEIRCDFSAELRGVYGTVRWQKLPHFDENDDHLDLERHSRDNASAYYAATMLNAPSEREVMLEIELGGPGKVWLRGVPLLDLDTRAHDLPGIEVKVRLALGDNLLLCKISGNAWLRVKVRERDGQPFSGQVAAPVLGAYAIGGGAPLVPTPECPHTAPWVQAAAGIEGQIKGVMEDDLDETSRAQIIARIKRNGALACLALDNIYRANRLEPEATEYLEIARAWLPEDPVLTLAFLREIGNSSLYSASEVNALRRGELARLLKADQPLPAALLEQAQLLARDERTGEAIELCMRAVNANPRAWTAHLAQAEIYQQRAWRTEWLAALERARKLAPRAPAIFRHFARYHEYGGEAANSLAESARLFEIWPGDYNLRISLISQFLRAARPEKALEIAKALVASRPGDSYALKRLADVYGALGNIDDALKCSEQLAGYTLRPEVILKDAASMLFAAGRESEGKAMLERILKLAPDQHDARRWLARLSGQPDEFWKPWALSDAEMLKNDVKPGDFPQCDSVILLDEQVQVVNQDGSSRMFVRQVRKILTQDGVDAHGKAHPSGEICIARTIRKNGQVLEPVTYRGNEVEFPGIEIGALLDLAYIQTEDENPWRGISPARFYFADQTLAAPFMISRLVVVAPANMIPDVRYHNWPESATKQQERQGAMLVRTWDVREAKFREREPFMPSALEFIPWLEFTQAGDWRLRARELAETALPLLRTTQAVSRFAAKLTQGCTSDEARARAIYTWVNANLATEGDSRNAHQAIKARAGDRRKTFAALCFAAGVRLGFAYADAPPAYRGGEVESLPVPDWAGPGEKDFKNLLFIVYAENGARIFVNLDARLRPFGACSQRLDGAPAILWEQGKSSLIKLPGGEIGRDGFHNQTRIALAADGSAKVEGAIETRGERSYDLKELVRKQSSDERNRELEEQVADQFAGFEAETFTFDDLETIGAPLKRGFKGKAPSLAPLTGGKLVFALPLEKFGPLLSALVNKDKREFDLVLDFDLCQTDELRIKPPEGWNFERLPPDVLLPCAPLSYSLSFALEDGELVVRRSVQLGPGRVPVHAYADFVREIRKLSQGEDVTFRLVKDGVKAAAPDEIKPK